MPKDIKLLLAALALMLKGLRRRLVVPMLTQKVLKRQQVDLVLMQKV